ncbi:carbamoyltransferase N-terminal domain-containing protein [Nocardia sp. NPDC050710]|uniref:carbamoyltransferase N-terminal domain-containing protein n=1 Tax=Nocardia sp. NPDC050710 TaxID=3157220 RepID=UPI0034045A22
MKICGLKLTHDAAVALVDDGDLVFSVEIEKLANNGRYSDISDLSIVSEILSSFGYTIFDVDEWVIDGWDGDRGRDLELLDDGRPTVVRVGPYRETPSFPVLEPAVTGKITIEHTALPYTGYSHAAGHLACTYGTSPYAHRGEPSFVLVWDGGLFPRLYFVDPATGVDSVGNLFPLIGHAYAMAALHFGPYQQLPQRTKADELSIAGKLMAYIALGRARQPILDCLREVFHEIFESDLPAAREYRRTVGGFGSLFELSRPPVDRMFATLRERMPPDAFSDEDVLATVHLFLEELLVSRIEDAVRRRGDGPWNLCLAGGCALNIKWNSAMRASSVFESVWIPPFPNDSGSALGTAVLGMWQHMGIQPLRWDVRRGPQLVTTGDIPPDWSASPMGVAELAAVLHREGEPVVVLDGRAELGPRALGGRSIIAPATDPAMKDRLNDIKNREPYRPIAPICLAAEAPRIFDPGIPDPYMLFDHTVRTEWLDRVPAIIHLDGTARLQTVDPTATPFLGELLTEYFRLTGIPVLCNTSANFNGSGFFPDVASAMKWGKVDRIWSAGTLYRRSR